MTDNMFGFQINFGKKTHKKARWKRARKRYLKRYREECKRCGTMDDLFDLNENICNHVQIVQLMKHDLTLQRCFKAERNTENE